MISTASGHKIRKIWKVQKTRKTNLEDSKKKFEDSKNGIFKKITDFEKKANIHKKYYFPLRFIE